MPRRLWDDCGMLGACSSDQRCPPPAAASRRHVQDSEPVTALALSPDGRLLFAASRSLQLRCWSMEGGQVLRSYKGHKAPIADMAVDATSGLLAGGAGTKQGLLALCLAGCLPRQACRSCQPAT